MTSWAHPSTDTPNPAPWNSKHALNALGRETRDRWRQAFTVTCEAHAVPENIIDECHDTQRRENSSFEWLQQPMNRQRPPQNVQQLLQGNLFPQTLRLHNPNDARDGSIHRCLQEERTPSYLRVVLKPNKRHHGSERARPNSTSCSPPPPSRSLCEVTKCASPDWVMIDFFEGFLAGRTLFYSPKTLCCVQSLCGSS